MDSVLVDHRWGGDTGIGRMYREVVNRIPSHVSIIRYNDSVPLGNPLSPFHLSKAIRDIHSDVFWSPSYIPPLFSKTPYVITIHDLMHLFYYSGGHRLYYKWVIAPLAKKAKKVITVSHFSKMQLIEHLGIAPERIEVIYNGISEHFLKNNLSYESDRPYFFYVGNRRRNKNLEGMLAAFAKARIDSSYLFYLSGNQDLEIIRLIERLGIKDRVRFLGFIEEEELPRIYKGAYATFFASHMEGFGLPVLESMASGTPVITSNASSLAEISGGAAILVNSRNVLDMSAALERLVSSQSLYGQCVERGLSQVKHFSWDKTAKETWDVILS